HSACAEGRADEALFLLSRGAHADARAADGRAPLHDAAGAGHVEIARALIKAGADPLARTADNTTAMHFAAGRGRVEMLTLLISHKAPVNVRNDVGASPLDRARLHEHADAVRLLESQSTRS